MKLLNNSNFWINLNSNIDNCILEPLYNDLNEISYIKKFTTIFSDDTFRHFFLPEHLREEVIQNFQGKIIALNKNDPTYEARKGYYENAMKELNATESFKREKRGKKIKFQEIGEKKWLFWPEKNKNDCRI